MSKPRTHLVPTGTMPTSSPQPRKIPLRTPPRFLGGPQSNKFPMYSMCETFSVYGVNASPRRTGTTGGHGQVISRRPLVTF